MKNDKVLFAKLHFAFIKAENVLLLLVFLGACKTLTLNSCHIKHVKHRHCFLKGLDLNKLLAACINYVLDILWQLKLVGGNKDKFVVLVAGKGFD